ncbi:MAG: DNA adenine methylase [Treponema sp.]|nr:DNA adenine methylase [Treponema sp.]
MDFDTPYLTKQIIAYIGNKRKLLSLIYAALEQSGVTLGAGTSFADLFSGSGVVSRFAKFLGFEVYANDWEPYAEILSRGFVALNQSECKKLFKDEKAFCDLLEKINSLPEPAEADQYIARYYAPHTDDVAQADFRTERLFYTRQNALALDKIRNYIEQKFPKEDDPRRHILIALLIYEAATHTNTSGVFKAFHKGFGGHGKDALSRILAPIALHEPVLADSDAPVHVFRQDANELVRTLPELDVVYLDPPYNQHQYGSNYHLLNTIAEWDKIPEPMDLDENGVLVNKAAIRADWVKTRSLYCYKKTATDTFRDLVQHIKSKLILVSYSSDGIIPFEEMKQICLEKGYVSIVTSDYTVYRGGKQSNSRKNTDIEFILAIDTKRKAKPECSERIDKVILEKQILVLLKRRFNRARLAENCQLTNDSLYVNLTAPTNQFSENNVVPAESRDSVVGTDKRTIVLSHVDGFMLALPYEIDLTQYTYAELKKITEVLETCACQTKVEELNELIRLTTDSSLPLVNAKKYIRQIPATLKKLAQKKYKIEYYVMLKQVQELAQTRAELYPLIAEKISAVHAQAEIRFNS